MISKDHKPVLVCFRCGSFDIEILNEKEGKRVYKCKNCGKVWVKDVVRNE